MEAFIKELEKCNKEQKEFILVKPGNGVLAGIPGGGKSKDYPNRNFRAGDADPIMIRFSSSAAHISGKKLVSSETFTWLREHFRTALSQCKPEAEDLFVNGINHIFLHGSTYSPDKAEWPGWKFYATVNFNSTNPIWEDAPSLFSYISRVQSMLQLGNPDNEILLFWPSLAHSFNI